MCICQQYLRPFNCVQTTDCNTWKSLTVGNKTICVKEQYLKNFNCMQINDKYHLELLALNNNNWNHLNMRKQLSSDSFKNNVTDQQFA